MILKQQKTEHERVSFIKKFAAIVNGNVKLKDNYLISFADVNYATHFYITTRDRKLLNIIQLLTKFEYKEYLGLLNKWEK